MARKRSKGAAAVNRWREAQGVTAHGLAAAVGDRGGQVVKWLNGSRNRLPVRLKVAICRHTGLSIAEVCNSDEVRLARDVLAVMQRDAATDGSAAA